MKLGILDKGLKRIAQEYEPDYEAERTKFVEKLHTDILKVLHGVENDIEMQKQYSEEGSLEDEPDSNTFLEWYHDFLVSDWPEIAEDALTETGFYSE